MNRTLRAGGTAVTIAGGRVAAAGTPAPSAPAPVALPDRWRITPALIDLQVNGLGDAFPLADPSALERLDAMLAAAGVGTWLVAVPTAEPEQVAALARAVADLIGAGRGTGLAGIHLEGPVLSPGFPGAHPPELIRSGDDPEALALLELPHVRVVTLAPEAPGAMGYARAAMARGITVAAGHTGATFEQARGAIDDGIRLATHVFNAMTPFHHRAPGAALAYLTDERARVAFIADGEHLHAATEDLVLATAGTRALLVSDAAPDAGVAPGRMPPAGVLAGSSATLADAVARLATRHGFDAAVRLATEGPAAVLGTEASLASGAPADLTIWDADGRVAGCIRGGEVAAATEELRALL